MSKKSQKNTIGRSVIKDRFGKKKRSQKSSDTFLHTSQLEDGYDWGRLNLQSVTEQSNLEDFLATAELAGTEFAAEKLNVKFVDPHDSGLPTKEQEEEIQALHIEHQKLLRVPRRPQWDNSTSPDELDRREKDNFLEWRRSLASLQEVDGIVLTPYEKNLDFWRQLWRVVERSDIIVQIVDARNPLLFRCQDLEKYVSEFGSKINLLLINKADFLAPRQRKIWAEYFSTAGVRIAFWSALEETARQNKEKQHPVENEMLGSESTESDISSGEGSEHSATCGNKSEDSESVPYDAEEFETHKENLSPEKFNQCLTEESTVLTGDSESSPVTDFPSKSPRNDNCQKFDESPTGKEESNRLNEKVEGKTNIDDEECDVSKPPVRDSEKVDDVVNDGNTKISKTENDLLKTDVDNTPETVNEDSGNMVNSSAILSGPELLELFRNLHTGDKYQEGVVTVGMVGYPNVGKSSTINAILQMKKVPVSATPGRTKHFQTLYVDPCVMLCDCPGLVFPSFVSTKADLIINGILPIDQMRDFVAPVSLICSHIPRDRLEQTYGITIPKPKEGEDMERCPNAYELLNSHGYMRGFMTANGMPDCSRSGRVILKDYVNGRLLYCHHPPSVGAEEFYSDNADLHNKSKGGHQATAMQDTKGYQKHVPTQSKMDRDFFSKVESGIHSKGVHGVSGFTRVSGGTHVGTVRDGTQSSPYSSSQSLSGKPWKKHNNRKKKEKLRRVYSNDSD